MEEQMVSLPVGERANSVRYLLCKYGDRSLRPAGEKVRMRGIRVKVPSSSFLRDHSRSLRRDQTDAERKLWMHLRNRQVGGVKFRRQHFITPFIADFCCPEKQLIIELDGGQHAERVEADRRRTGFLESQGYRVIRFWNHEVLENIEGVLEQVVTILNDPHPIPLPSRERGGENKDHG